MPKKDTGKSLADRLKGKDPEFLKFLEEEDKGLLKEDYDDEDDVDEDEIDDSAASSEADSEEEEEEWSDIESTDDDEEADDDDDDDDEDKDDEDDEDEMDLEEEEISFERSDDEMETENDATQETSEQHKMQLITKEMIEGWVANLQNDSVESLRDLVEAFKAALILTGNAQEVKSKYVIKGSSVFNKVVNACMVEVAPMLFRVLNMPQSNDPNKVPLPSNKNKGWKKLKSTTGDYLSALLQFLSSVASFDMKETVIKHFHQIVVFCSCFPKLSKTALKKLISMWSTEEETIRVVALGCLIRLLLHVPEKLFEKSLKDMYMEYSKNCKFTTVQTLPLINYMRSSLVEIMALKPKLAYRCAFLSLKAMAVKLRSLSYGHGHGKEKKGKDKKDKDKKDKGKDKKDKGKDKKDKGKDKKDKGKEKKKKTSKKGAKDAQKQPSIPSVYNWPYIHSLSLWIGVMCKTQSDQEMQQLVHPTVELVVGTLRVSSSPQYYPLRFHCVEMLIQLTEATEGKTFVPVLPFITEILECPALHKYGKQSAMKFCNLDVNLRMTKNEVNEKIYLDSLIDQTCESILHYCSSLGHTVAFPELVLATVLQLKKFFKSTKAENYKKKIKDLIQLIENHSNLVKKKRDEATFDLRDIRAVESWEKNMKDQKNALRTKFEALRKISMEKKALLLADKDKIEKMPELHPLKEKGPKTATEEEREQFPGLFKALDSDEDEDSGAEDDESADEDSIDEEDMDSEEMEDEDDDDDEESDDE